MDASQQTSVPSLQHDKVAWFRYFNTYGQGFSFDQLMHALTITPSIYSLVDVEAMRSSLRDLWNYFDRDRSGFIDMSEFVSVGGLADAIISQLPPANRYPMTTPSITSSYITSYLGAPPPDYQSMLQHIMATLPGTSRTTAEYALLGASYNPDLAVHNLIKQRDAAAIAQAASAPPLPPPTAPVAAQSCAHSTNAGYVKKYPVMQQLQVAQPAPEIFRCFNCHSDFSVDSTTVPVDVQLLNSTCPTCLTVNQVKLTRPYLHSLQLPSAPQPVNYGPSFPLPVPPQQPYKPTVVVMFPPNPIASHAMPIYQTASSTSVWRPIPGLLEQPAPPSSFIGSSRGSGRKKALLIGINYFGQRGELKGCLNDVDNVYRLLTEQYGWDRRDMTILVDGKCPNLPSDIEIRLPTRSNIISRMRWLVGDCIPGDSLFLLFSGHGGQKEDPHGVEEDGMNETILPGNITQYNGHSK